MYVNNMANYPPQNGMSNLRRQRSKSDINNKQKYHSPRGNGNNEIPNGTPEKKSPRWPQEGRKDNSERRRARSFGAKMSNQSSVTPKSNLEDRSKRKSSPLSNLVNNPEMDRAVSDKDSHGSHDSSSPIDSPSGEGPEWEDEQLLFDIEPEQQQQQHQQQWNGQKAQQLYAQQQAEMFANYQNMHLGHSQPQMQPMYPNNPHMMPPNGNGHGQMGWGVNGMGIPNGYVPYIMGSSPNEHFMYSQPQMPYMQPPMQQNPTHSEKQRYQSKG